ncbi:GTP 3',8-cyclase MoaA [Oceanirhabdus sp. W0125-5]|uniref:GTP 3',8-cyclase MoaA n=1 Tax=Oceanirhabdus sp. W0125-5 TaxID=2999116 RepID=UPI0022F30CC7|nr:GTP 3',8-cyclase MoaA [Oceanirhabdus sp. W0125-5]WBW99506.1 GTP 3',8-cyclase MoaA [Oceanirhabdus sp. W0125-5]
MIDKKGRKINYLRVSLTDRCNLRCTYCMPEEGIIKKSHDDILHFKDILKVIKAASNLGVKKVRFTGGEPLIVKGVDELIYETSKIQGINDISLTTNGILLSDKIHDLKRAGLNRVNISLDTLDKDKYKAITRGGELNKVLDAIDKCQELGIKSIKINAVLIKGFNDNEIESFIKLTKESTIHVRFIELMPIGEGVKFFNDSFISSKEIINRYPQLIPVEREEFGTAELFKLKDGKGRIGFINPLSCKFCVECNRIRLTSEGGIKPCLHSAEEYNIKKYLNNEAIMTKELENIIYNKPLEHHLGEDKLSGSKKMMFQIGG